MSIYYHHELAILSNVSDKIDLPEKQSFAGVGFNNCCGYGWVLVT